GALVEKLFAGRATDAATLVTAELVQQPRERRVRSMMNRALRIVADQRGRSVAIVRVANELDAAQRVRLAAVLRERYGKDVALNVIVDPEVVGGVRIEIGDDVIDGTVSSRIKHLRQKLAG
ncbi:MAG TPA: F0F1 ATP synthase subunit delta, partial [Microbacterium sp.]|nr:F0F1 ATP synthase subunit delta [Microbacterium sp.]